MDRALAESVKKKRKRAVVLRITITGLLLLLAIFALRHLIQPGIHQGDFYFSVAERGDINASVSASGTVLPEFEEVKNSPIQSAIVKIHRNTGEEVECGDTILSLDTKKTLFELDKLKDQLALKKNSVHQLKLQLEKDLLDLRTEYQIKKLHVESMEAALDEEKYLNNIGGGTLEQIKKAELNLKIAKLELDQINQTIKNKEKSVKADLKGLNYEINIQKKNVMELKEKLDRATIKADKKGVITWINSQIGQTVNAGEELVKIADLQSYKIEGTISDMHAAKLHIAGKIIARINEDTDLPGVVVNISPSVQNNIIEFAIKLDDKNHSLLRPNMRVDVFVQTDYREDVVRLENGAFYRGGNRQNVFVVQDDKLIRKEAEFGKSNFDYVEIVGGIKEHDVVVISDMSDYEKWEKLKIKRD